MTTVDSFIEPKIYHQNVRDPKLCDAMKDEIQAIERNNTGHLLPYPLASGHLAVNEFIVSNTAPMALLSSIKASFSYLGEYIG